MQQQARTTRGWRHWTGRVLPVVAVALLALGPAHGKDKDKKKKQREAEVAAQVERQAERPVQAEQVVRVERPDDAGYTPGEPPAVLGKKSKNTPPVQNIREPSRAETLAEPRAVSIDRVIVEIERRYKAKVVRADKKTSRDRQIYELRLLWDDGNVKTIRVDAETGKEI
jgi:uncharacterized membrane protein YkoI